MRLRLLPLALIAALAVVASLGAGSAVAKSCSVRTSDYPGDGYFTSLRVSGVGCSTGKSVAREHYRKRLRKGGKDGKFNGSVKGYSCRESSRSKTSTELNARVTCKRSGKKIVFTYQQNL
jgi:hypothetical protein